MGSSFHQEEQEQKKVSLPVSLMYLLVVNSVLSLITCGALCWYQSLMRSHASSCSENGGEESRERDEAMDSEDRVELLVL